MNSSGWSATDFRPLQDHSPNVSAQGIDLDAQCDRESGFLNEIVFLKGIDSLLRDALHDVEARYLLEDRVSQAVDQIYSRLRSLRLVQQAIASERARLQGTNSARHT